jgi:hypothetical protein
VVHNSFIESAMEQGKPREIIECICLGDSPLGCRTWSMSRRIAEHAKEALELAVDTAVFAALADFAMSPGMVPPVMLHAEEHSGTGFAWCGNPCNLPEPGRSSPSGTFRFSQGISSARENLKGAYLRSRRSTEPKLATA